jgi:hypothetical protein
MLSAYSHAQLRGLLLISRWNALRYAILRLTPHAPDRLNRANFPRWQYINLFPVVNRLLASRRVM